MDSIQYPKSISKWGVFEVSCKDIESHEENGEKNPFIDHAISGRFMNKSEEVSVEGFYDDETSFEVDVIDTWHMTIEKMGVFSGKFRIPLPGTAYMAIRIYRS